MNLVKTNDPARPAAGPEVYEDYAASLTALQDRADYIALNLSCPNSAADRDFFDELARIDELLARLAACDVRVPLILKLKPTRDAGVLREIVAIADRHPFVSGFAINLPSGKPADLNLTVSRDSLERMPGAVGGPPVEELVNAILGTLKSIVGDRYALIAAGGVTERRGRLPQAAPGRDHRPALHRPRLPRAGAGEGDPRRAGRAARARRHRERARGVTRSPSPAEELFTVHVLVAGESHAAMALTHYGVLNGQLTGHHRDTPDDQGRWFHVMLDVTAAGAHYRCAIDVDSKQSLTGVQWRVLQIAPEQIPPVPGFAAGYHELPRTPSSGALDLIRHPAAEAVSGLHVRRQAAGLVAGHRSIA